MKKIVDLRSDTVTVPTPKMREAMAAAEVGDDVYGEDPTINELERVVAEACGMEAAIFTASGTMGNQAAIMAHMNRGEELICEEMAHIFLFEGAGIAGLSGAQARTVRADDGILTPQVVKRLIRPLIDVHQPLTKLICLENTHNFSGGNYYTLEQLAQMRALCDKHNLKLHMDGARVMNAAIALDKPLGEITKYLDSISICISKGLCAPVGALVAGSGEFVQKVKRMRKSIGGGMRQAGILAAAGLIAFQEMPEYLADDHRRAKMLAQGCKEIGFAIDTDTVKTNIVIVPDENAQKISLALKEEGVLANVFGEGRFRFVTHYGIDDNDIDHALVKLKKIKSLM